MPQRRNPRSPEQRSPYFQEYGPISRRRAAHSRGEPLDEEETLPYEGAMPNEDELAPPVVRRRRSISPLRLLLLIATLGAILLFAPAFAINGLFGQRILPGISVQGMPVSGMLPTEARTALVSRYDPFLREPVTITFGERRWQPTLSELGVTLDLDAAVHEASRAGRTPNPLSRFADIWQILRGGYDIAPPLVVNQQQMQRYVNTSLANIEQPPTDGALSLAAGKIVPTGGQPGRQVLVDATIIDLIQSLQQLTPHTVALRTRMLDPVVTDSGVRAGVESAEQLLQGPLVLRQGERSWVWEVDQLAELLQVQRSERSLRVQPDEARVAEAVERLAQVVDTGSVEPRLQFGANGLEVLAIGHTGVALRQEEARALIMEAFASTNREIELPVEELRPQVDINNLAVLGITDLLGEGKSSFAGSEAYRITNIEAGAALLHGVLIAPDEEFSFNKTIGEISPATGFVEGYAIIGNRTQLEWGGGICQDSTTVFRAAFWAGLPITERHAHAFRISWYEAFDPIGMDATIYTGVQDLKFLNDTGNWILMQAWVDEANQVLSIGLYGSPHGRSVRLEGPFISNEIAAPAQPVYVDDSSLPSGTVRQTDVARGGMDIVINRIVTINGVEQPAESFFTRFKAWPNVFVRGTG